MQVIVNGSLINYTVSGDANKPCVVLLHGWLDSLQTFNQLVTVLKGDYYLIAIDWPGFGQSSTPPPTADLNWYTNVLVSLTEKLQLTPVAYIGHSFGARVLLNTFGNNKALATAQPMAKLVLIGGAGITSPSLFKTALRLLAKPVRALKYCLPSSLYEQFRRRLYRLLGSDYAVSSRIGAVYTQIIGHDLRAAASCIENQTLLIYGENDTATPVSFGQQFAQLIKNSTLHVIPHADHFVHQTHAVPVADLIRHNL